MAVSTARSNLQRILVSGCICVLCVAIPLSLSGCSNILSGSAQPSADWRECGRAKQHLLNLRLRGNGAPNVALPKPAGWLDTWGTFDGQPSVTIGNPTLTFDGHVPNVMLIVDRYDAGGITGDPQLRALDDDLADVAKAGTIVHQKTGTVCGYPSVWVQYEVRGLQSAALIVAVERGARQVWRLRLNFLSREPDNPQWHKDTQTMIDGIVISKNTAQ